MEADADHNFKEMFLEVNEVNTHVIQFGLREPLRHLSFSKISKKSEFSNHKYVILVIPGNPGSIQFYTHFMASIYQKLQVPVIGVSHAGHVSIPHGLQKNKPQDEYSVNDQILHKLLFIENYIPKDVNLILIGHSMGAYAILEMLKTIGNERKVLHNFFLFPVIERLYDLWRSKILSFTFTLLYLPILTFVFFLNLFTEKWKLRIVRFFVEKVYKMDNCPECLVEGGVDLFNTNVVRNIIHLFKSEINEINELHISTLKSHIHKVSLMYSDIDHWCPTNYYHDMCEKFPGEDITLSFEQVPHAFVINKEVTDFVANCVCEKIRLILQQ